MNPDKTSPRPNGTKPLILAVGALLGLVVLFGLLLRATETRVSGLPTSQAELPSDSAAITTEVSIQPVLDLQFPGAAAPVRNKLAALQEKLRKNENDSKAMAAIAMTLMAHELKPAAIPSLEVLQTRQPDKYEWPYLLGHCRMFTDPDQAAVDFRRATKLAPENVAAYMMLAEVFLANGRLDEASKLLGDTLPDRVKRHPWVAWQQSRLFMLLKEYEKCEQQLQKLRKSGIVSRSLLRQLLMVKRRIDRDADLTALNKELADCPDELLSWECPVMVAVAQEKVDTQTVLALAQAQLTRNNFRGAIDVFKKAMAEQPNSPELMFYLAQLWLQSGDAERADAILQVASEFEQNSLRILLLRTRIAIIRKDWDLAQEMCDKSMTVKRDSAESWYLQAEIQKQQNQLSEAQTSVAEALRLDPERQDALKLQKELAAKPPT